MQIHPQLQPPRDEVGVGVEVKAQVVVVRRSKQIEAEVAVPVEAEKRRLMQQMPIKRLQERTSHLIPQTRQTTRMQTRVVVEVEVEVVVRAKVHRGEEVKAREEVQANVGEVLSSQKMRGVQAPAIHLNPRNHPLPILILPTKIRSSLFLFHIFHPK